MKAQIRVWLFISCTVLLSGGLVLNTVNAQEPENNATSPGQSNVVDMISTEYNDFLGENAEIVVTGLRDGSEITLTDGSTTTSFTPPTGNMGYGNVSLSLGLAQEQLNQYGITEPTAEELQASLVGGEINTTSGGTAQLDGVLTLRSQGMGWGEIAHEYGVQLGHVISSVKSGRTHVLTDTITQTGVGGSDGAPAAGDASSSNQGKGHAYGKGIVTGTGAASSGHSSVSSGSSGKQGNAYGHGITTGSGAPVSPSGINPAHSSSNASQGKGHSK